MAKKKVCFLGYTDYGNVMTYWSHAINLYSSNIESKSICVIPHKYGYDVKHGIDLCTSSENDSLAVNQVKKQQALDWILQCDQIVFTEELSLLNSPRRYKSMQLFQQILGFHLLELKLFKPSLKLHIWHCGIDYRSAFKEFDEINENYFDKILMGGDLYRLCPKNSKYFVPVGSYQTNESSQDIYSLIDAKFSSDDIKILHAPSSHVTKGTETIRAVVGAVLECLPVDVRQRVSYQETTSPTVNEDIIKKKKQSHIYIDQFHKDIGGYGMSSIEALAYGNIVMSSIHFMEKDSLEIQCLSKELANDFPIVDTTINVDIFKEKLKKIVMKSTADLKLQAKNSYQFYEKLFSYKAVANYFENVFFCD